MLKHDFRKSHSINYSVDKNNKQDKNILKKVITDRKLLSRNFVIINGIESQKAAENLITAG